MPHFVQHTLYEPSLPMSYLRLLRWLDDFDHLAENAKEALGQDRQDMLEDLAALHDALESGSRQDLTPDDDALTQAEAEHAFAVAVMRLSYYSETVMSDDIALVDTCGSHTLDSFVADAQPHSRPHLRRATAEAFGFDEAAMAKLDAELTSELGAMELRKQIITAFEALHPLTGSAQDLDQATHAIFSRLYPGHPLRPGEIKIIRVGTGFFFGIPYLGTTLRSEHQRSESELAATAKFLKRLAGFKQRYYAHFPSFGFFRGEDADPDTLTEIAQMVSSTPEHVAAMLTTMVTVIPLDEIDKYIVHDVWGHYWQALLFRFEETYKEVSAYLQQPPLKGSMLDALKQAVKSANNADDAINTDAWDTMLRQSMEERLAQSMSGLLAEVLADAVEYKVLAMKPQLATLMPSSSFFKHLPAKLDLTLRDLPFYFRLALGWYRRMARPEQQAHLHEDYLAAHPNTDPDTLTKAIEAITERTESWLDEVYHPSFRYTPTQDRIHINIFARVALNYAALHLAINDLHDTLTKRTFPTQGPLSGALDLMVFAAASFYEDQRTRNFWHIDEFLALHFEPCLDKLMAALERQTAP